MLLDNLIEWRLLIYNINDSKPKKSSKHRFSVMFGSLQYRTIKLSEHQLKAIHERHR